MLALEIRTALAVACIVLRGVAAFSPAPQGTAHRSSAAAVLHLFDKMFEEEGPLGKGITVGKVQVAMMATGRGKDSIFGDLERKARSTGDSSAHLALLAKEVCLALLRRSEDWTAACSESKWFKFDDAGKAESLFNDWANKEAVKFEKVGR